MTPKTYLRPIGLSYGGDGRRAVAQRLAGPLAGSPWIAFHAVEVIERAGAITRRIVPYTELRGDARLAALTAPRPPLCGLDLDRPQVMGIVNVTPDSFSDGGRNAEAGLAIANGLTMAEQGAGILDVGGESTRPGSDAVPLETELARVLPVIEALAAKGHCVSCDTRKAAVMRRAAGAGASIINDVSALAHDPESLATAAGLGAPVILMHAQGDPKTMQLAPKYDDVALDVFDHLEARIAAAKAAGVAMLCADPGIGFGKTYAHNLAILSQLTLFHGLGVPLLVGLSRKSMIGALTGVKAPAERVHGSLGGAVQAALNGAQILRVHDVKETVAALAVALAVADPAASGL